MTRTDPGSPRAASTFRVDVRRPDGAGWRVEGDRVAIEEPLEVRVAEVAGGPEHRLGLLLRTPGMDAELVTGLLFAEGLIHSVSEIASLEATPAGQDAQEFNSVLVRLSGGRPVDWERLGRPLVMTSACGVCGRAMLGALRENASPPEGAFRVSRAVLAGLPDTLRAAQSVFEATGGLHAAALARPDGSLERVAEDVGRHNAVDKVVGGALRAGGTQFSRRILLVSGRAGYEIVQKAVRAGIPVVAAVGAPSSLAVDAAREFGTTLVGFLRGDRFNVYVSADRLTP